HPASPPPDHLALPERAALDIDQQASSATTHDKISSPAGRDLGSKGLEPGHVPHADQGIITPSDPVPNITANVSIAESPEAAAHSLCARFDSKQMAAVAPL